MALNPSDGLVPFHVDVFQAQQYLHELVTWQPPTSAMNVLGLVGVISLIYLVGWLLNRPRRLPAEEDAMAKHFRNARVRFFVGEGVTEFVEEGVFKDKITRLEAKDIYNKIGHAFHLVDLLPRGTPIKKLSRGQVEHLKEKIKSRIQKQTIDNVVDIKEKKIGVNMLKRRA